MFEIPNFTGSWILSFKKKPILDISPFNPKRISIIVSILQYIIFHLILVGKSSGVYIQIMANVVDTNRLPIMAMTTIGQSLGYTPRSKGNIRRKAVPEINIQIMYGHLLPVLINNILQANRKEK